VAEALFGAIGVFGAHLVCVERPTLAFGVPVQVVVTPRRTVLRNARAAVVPDELVDHSAHAKDLIEDGLGVRTHAVVEMHD